MARRQRGGGGVAMLAVLVLAIGAGAALLSVIFRSREPARAPVADAELKIEVLNGCGSPGAADRVAMLLRREGFQVSLVGNADHFHYRQDIVVARTLSRERAVDLGRTLGGVVAVEQRIPGHEYDITVVVGRPRSLVGD